MNRPRLVLVLGGTRSGKSEVAERLVARAAGSDADGAADGATVTYLATAPTGPSGDGERIAAHRARRPASWRTVEVGGALAPAAAVRDAPDGPVLLDGLGAWLAGLLHEAGLLDDDGRAEDPADGIGGASAIAGIEDAIAALADAADARPHPTVVVGEEAGMAPVAATRGTRRWVDLLGTSHQALAARADRVLLVVAGRAVELPAAGAATLDPDGAAPPSSSPAASARAGIEVAAAEAAVAAGAPGTPEAESGAPTLPLGEGAERGAAADDPVDVAATADAPVVSSVAFPAVRAAVPAGGAGRSGDVPGHAAGAGDAGPATSGPADLTTRPFPGHEPGPPELRLHGDRMVPAGAIDLAVNVVMGDPPGWAIQALRAGLEDVAAYPDDRPAANALAARHGRPPAGVLPLAGAVEGFWRLALALRPRKAAILVPGFTEAEAALRAVGSEIVHVPRDPRADWALDPSAVPEDCDLVALGRPDNPTGVQDPREVVLRLRRPGRTVLVDEAFGDFLEAPADALADHRASDDGPGTLVVLRSLTKILSVPGARCGYLLGDPDLVDLVRDAGPPWTCPSPSLSLLRAYASRPEACERIAGRTSAHRRDLVARVRQLAGVQVWDAAANFVLVRGPADIDLARGLLRRGIAVRPCRTFATLDDSSARIAVRTPAIHAQLATALAATISEAEREG